MYDAEHHFTTSFAAPHLTREGPAAAAELAAVAAPFAPQCGRSLSYGPAQSRVVPQYTVPVPCAHAFFHVQVHEAKQCSQTLRLHRRPAASRGGGGGGMTSGFEIQRHDAEFMPDSLSDQRDDPNVLCLAALGKGGAGGCTPAPERSRPRRVHQKRPIQRSCPQPPLRPATEPCRTRLKRPKGVDDGSRAASKIPPPPCRSPPQGRRSPTTPWGMVTK